MLQDLQLAGLGERTQESYLRAVRKFAQWLHKAPDQATENELRRYLLFIKNDQQWEANSLKVAYSGLKFFYAHTRPQDWPTLRKLRVPKQLKLPTVLTIPEVDQLIHDIRKPALKCFFWTVYRVAISNRRVVKCEPGPDGLGRITFTYRKSGSRRYRAMTVTADEFIRRFLQHVLSRGVQKVRHFGFSRHRCDREWLQMLVTVTLQAVYVLQVAAQPLPVPHRPSCPPCGAELTFVGFVPAPGQEGRFVSTDTS